MRAWLLGLVLCTAACGGGDENATAPRLPKGDGGNAGAAAGGTGSGESGGTGGVTTGGAAGAGGVSAEECAAEDWVDRWVTVDDFSFAVGEDTRIVSITALSGTVFAAGWGKKQGVMEGIIRRSTDGGATWVGVPWSGAIPNDITVDAVGDVYVAAATTSERVVRRSTDLGATWKDVDAYPRSDDPEDDCDGGFVSTGPSGVVVSGASCDSAGWVVRRSVKGAPFEQVFAVAPISENPTRLSGLRVDNAGGALAVGYGIEEYPAFSEWLTVTEGDPKGVVVADIWPWEVSRALGISDSGEVLVAGMKGEYIYPQYGEVRYFDGTKWDTLTFGSDSTRDVVAVGNYLVLLNEFKYENMPTWVNTKVLSRDKHVYAGGASFRYVWEHHTEASALTTDPAGNVYSAISGQDEGGAYHWLVRKLDCLSASNQGYETAR